MYFNYLFKVSKAVSTMFFISKLFYSPLCFDRMQGWKSGSGSHLHNLINKKMIIINLCQITNEFIYKDITTYFLRLLLSAGGNRYRLFPFYWLFSFGFTYLFLSFTYLRLSFKFFITHILHTKNSH